jgi:hypothetical protein
MAWDSPYGIKRARILKEQKHFTNLPTRTTTTPNLYGPRHAIASYASQLGGVIAGGTALKFFSPNYHTSDVDIITTSNRHLFAQSLVNRLNAQYGPRFRVIAGNRAARVFDRIERKYVADIVNYPLREEHIVSVGPKGSNFKVTTPEHVFAGRLTNLYEKKQKIENKIRKFLF